MVLVVRGCTDNAVGLHGTRQDEKHQAGQVADWSTALAYLGLGELVNSVTASQVGQDRAHMGSCAVQDVEAEAEGESCPVDMRHGELHHAVYRVEVVGTSGRSAVEQACRHCPVTDNST